MSERALLYSYSAPQGRVTVSVKYDVSSHTATGEFSCTIDARDPKDRAVLARRVPGLKAAVLNAIAGSEVLETDFKVLTFRACRNSNCSGEDKQLVPKRVWSVEDFHTPDGDVYWNSRTFWAGKYEREMVCTCCGKRHHVRVTYVG